MKLYDVEETAQNLISDSAPTIAPQKDKLDFSGFNA
jgi:hypothetical protein